MNVNDIPKAWRDDFAAIQALIPAAVMAGGCLRDRDHGVKVKDIDIFVPVSEDRERDLHTVVSMLTKVGMEGTISGDKMYPESDNRIVGVVDVPGRPGRPPIQLVVGDWGLTLDDMFQRFDYGICQIAYDGRKIVKGQSYDGDSLARVFRLCTPRSREAFQQSVERFARLKADKYKDWSFDLGHFHAAYGGHNGGYLMFEGVRPASADDWLRSFYDAPLGQTYYPTARVVQPGPNLQQVKKRS